MIVTVVWRGCLLVLFTVVGFCVVGCWLLAVGLGLEF